MRLEHFKYLSMVAQTHSISLAADRLFISHQALSKALKSLEDELNIQLLIRTQKGVSLTPAGEYVLEAANKILEIISDIEYQFLPQKEKLQTGNLHIIAGTSLQNWLIPKYIGRFQKRYPNISVDTSVGSDEDIIASVENKDVDLGFIIIPYSNNQPTFSIPPTVEFVPLTESKYFVICPPTFPLAQLDSVTLHQLEDYHAIITPTPEGPNLHTILDDNRHKKIICSGYMLMSEYLDNSLGYLLMTRFLETAHTFEKYVHIPISNNIHAVFGYLVNKKNKENPLYKLFINEVIKSI